MKTASISIDKNIDKKRILKDIKDEIFIPLQKYYNLSDSKTNEYFSNCYKSIISESIGVKSVGDIKIECNKYTQSLRKELISNYDFFNSMSAIDFEVVVKMIGGLGKLNRMDYEETNRIIEGTIFGKNIIDLHGESISSTEEFMREISNYQGNDGERHIRNIFLNNSYETFSEFEKEVLESCGLYSIPELVFKQDFENKKGEEYSKFLDKVIQDSFGYNVYISEEDFKKFSEDEDGIRRFSEMFEENDFWNQNYAIVSGGTIYTGISSDLLIDLVKAIAVLSRTECIEYINTEKASDYFEYSLSHILSNKYIPDDVNFYNLFVDRVPNSHKPLYISIFFDLLCQYKGFSENLKDAYNMRGGHLDFYDITKEMFNTLYDGRKLFTKKDVKGLSRAGIMDLITDKSNGIVKEKLSLLPQLDLFDLKIDNFIYSLDVKSALVISQDKFGIWDERVLDTTLKILKDGHKNKSEYINDFTKEIDSSKREKLVDYLSDKEIYDEEGIISFEYDGVEEFLVMGVYPQPSCQNILVDTGHNRCLLAHTQIPYTKLLLSFRKPDGFKGIDFKTKEVLIEEDGVVKREKLVVEGRSVIVIGDSEEGVRMQGEYGLNCGNSRGISNNLIKKYGELGKSVADDFKRDKDRMDDDWFYEE